MSKGLNPVQKLLVKLTGTHTPRRKMIVSLNMGSSCRNVDELSGPAGKCVMIRQGDDLEIQWGKEDYAFFNPTEARRSWRLVERGKAP